MTDRERALSHAYQGETARLIAQLTLDGCEEGHAAVLQATGAFTRPLPHPEPSRAQKGL